MRRGIVQFMDMGLWCIKEAACMTAGGILSNISSLYRRTFQKYDLQYL